jgi:all-trans-retinol 13,14-reductase
MTDDITIVGGGISGLLTGAILAKKGHNVMLFEKSSKLGGRSNSIEKEGYIVDFGLHVIRYSTKSAIAKIFKKYLGEKLEMFNLGDIKLFKNGAFHDFPLSMRGLASTDLTPKNI